MNEFTNGVMMQYFEWYLEPDQTLWKKLQENAPGLRDKGITAFWLPPAHKGVGGGFDVGYGCYDLFDLGEFNQQKSVPTKYGTKDELLQMIAAVRALGMQVYADIVFNHKDGGDETEDFEAQEVSWDDRNIDIGEKQIIRAYTKFTFPNRNGAYSTTVWNHEFFDALTYNEFVGNNKHLYRLKDKTFSTEVSHEHSNYDYLMADDLDTSYPKTWQELVDWGFWFVQLTQVDGFRIDACKHISYSFFPKWLDTLSNHFSRTFFSVGEYWSEDVNDLHEYITDSQSVMSLFDSPLHFNFHNASNAYNTYDMRTLLDHTLMKEQPTRAVTFVENHDTQPCQALVSPVQDWFKPLAYAIILLRAEGYPCVFYADYYGSQYNDIGKGCGPITLTAHQWMIDLMLWARHAYGFGNQEDYFDHPNTIGWTRLGNQDHPGSMAVVLTNGDTGYKWMNMYRPNAAYYDKTGHFTDTIQTNADGWGQFPCPAGKVSVWLQV